MVFKSSWEKTQDIVTFSSEDLSSILSSLYDNNSVQCDLLSGGCANLNYKITKQRGSFEILRIYVRDSDSIGIENAISNIIDGLIPVPEFLQLRKANSNSIARLSFIEGITLRDLLLGDEEFDLYEIMYQIGDIINKIRQVKFPQAGIFDDKLNISRKIDKEFIFNYLNDLLNNENLINSLSKNIIDKVEDNKEEIVGILSDIEDVSLVHGDFDPANVLVDRKGGSWFVSGILDWEFAHAGSYITDVANMLRYRHLMPRGFQEGLIDSLAVPDNWGQIVNYNNLLSLFDLLSNTCPKVQPIRQSDIKSLIDLIVEEDL